MKKQEADAISRAGITSLCILCMVVGILSFLFGFFLTTVATRRHFTYQADFDYIRLFPIVILFTFGIILFLLAYKTFKKLQKQSVALSILIRELYIVVLSKDTWGKIAELCAYDHTKWKGIFLKRPFPKEYIVPLAITLFMIIMLLSLVFLIALY